MTARVAAPYQPGPQPALYNTDPGVYEPECDWAELGPGPGPAYPDTTEFLETMEAAAQQPPDPQPDPGPGPGLEPQLPLAGDYQGLGGPASVPLYTPAAFEAPARPVERTILDEIFLEPSNRQLDAYYRVLTKGKV